MIADLYRKKYPDRPVFIFTPGSLRTNFLEQYCSFCGLNPADVEKNFIFYTLNDTTIIRKLPKNFNESLVIIDEVHKLTHAKANDSPVLSFIYDTIDQSEDVHIVSGSGTPIETNINELMYITNLHLKDQFKTTQMFKNIFEIEDDIYIPRNEQKFLDLVSTFISYYNPEKQMEEGGSSAFPKVYYQQVWVPINPKREQALIDAVTAENERMKPPDENLKFRDPERYKLKKSLYYTAISRLSSSQKSNYKYPLLKIEDYRDAEKVPTKKKDEGDQGDVPIEMEEGFEGTDENLLGQEGGEEGSEEGGESNKKPFGYDTAVGMRIFDKPKEKRGWITEETLETLPDDSEKIFEIIEDIKENDGKHAVYTRFKTYYGSRLLGALLELSGIPYVFFDGDMDDKERVKVLKKFNSPNNLNGEKIKVIILTSAGSAGINLKEIRRFHILEQYFNLSYLKQVIGRGIRYLSHQRLPENQRNITVRNYYLELSDPNKTKNYSPDVLSEETAKSKDRTISVVRDIIQSLGV
jgi:hypothetical protein